jgi:exoribonuclease R
MEMEIDSLSMRNLLVGILELNSKYIYGHTSRNVPIYLFHPFNKSHPLVKVGCSEKDRSTNLFVLVEVDDDQTKIYKGHIVHILGKTGDVVAEANALKWFVAPFHKKIEKLPCPCPSIPLSQDNLSRVPIVDGWTINIDPPGCRDIDDCITLIPIDEQRWSLVITIADVAANVCEDSEMERLAYIQGQTVYQDGKAVAPMFPAWFSENQGSLIPGETRLGVSWIGTWNSQTSRLETGSFQETLIKNQETYTYDSILESNQFPFKILKDIASFLKGSITSDPHEWVEELMLFYNKEVAKHLLEKGIGILRSQTERDIQKAVLYGSHHPDLIHYGRMMAEYSVCLPGYLHRTLGNIPYCHATSPLRRYADLFNQRCLKAILRGKEEKPVEDGILIHLNGRQKQVKQHDRDFFLLQKVIGTSSGTLECIYLESLETRDVIYVPSWKRLLRIHRSFPGTTWKSGDKLNLEYYYNRNLPYWKDRMVFCLKPYCEEGRVKCPEISL